MRVVESGCLGHLRVGKRKLGLCNLGIYTVIEMVLPCRLYVSSLYTRSVVYIPKTAAGLTCDFVHSASLHFFPSSHGSSLNTIPLCSSATGDGCE
jgi:hypothetical protein